MSIVKFNPFGESTQFEREINNLLGNVFTGRESLKGQTGDWRPRVDVHEDENGYQVDLELPGLSREDVVVTFEDGRLTVSGERKFEEERKEKNLHRIERRYGSFSRSFSFPSQVESEKITASHENGLLTVTLPKSEEIKPKKIEIS